jgi:NADPH2:quinone reductase
MSRIVMMHEAGGPDVLRLENRDTPRPLPGQVLIRVHAIGLNRSDTMVRAGTYPMHKLPASLGFEAAGTIEALGDGVEGLAHGDRVAIIPDSATGYTTYGEHCVVAARLVAPLSPGQSFESGAALWGTILTAYNALIGFAALAPGDVVLISAASSGVGLSAIQLARQAGAIPIALTRQTAKIGQLRDAGAAHVFLSDDGLVDAVRSVTDGKGARVVFDMVGGPLLASLIRATAVGGIVTLNGALVAADAPFPVTEVMIRRLTLRGFVLQELMENAPALASARRLVEQGVADGVIRPIVARTFPLERIADAHRFLESDQQVGKIVVTVD